jgi:hypothetical protein
LSNGAKIPFRLKQVTTYDVNMGYYTAVNNESFNRNIKANNNWKVLKVPVLIDRLSDMEQDQMTDIRASIHGRGSYQLTGQAQVLQVSNET